MSDMLQLVSSLGTLNVDVRVVSLLSVANLDDKLKHVDIDSQVYCPLKR